MELIIIIIGIVLVILLALITWSLSSGLKQSEKDWATYNDLKNRANELNTKEEIEIFHKEFIEKTSNIHNTILSHKLQAIDSYVRGLYKNAK